MKLEGFYRAEAPKVEGVKLMEEPKRRRTHLEPVAGERRAPRRCNMQCRVPGVSQIGEELGVAPNHEYR